MPRAGAPFTGARDYVMRFPPGQTPPVNAFWSVTMYDPNGRLVANSINRYALADRDPMQ